MQREYAYHCYDEFTVRRVQQILVFRKLRIPLKQIAQILIDEDIQQTYVCMQERLKEVEWEISALETVRSVLQQFVSRLHARNTVANSVDLLEDKSITEIVNMLIPPKSTLKETQMCTMDLVGAEGTFSRDLRIRIVILPPMTVAAYHFIGENPEESVGDVIDKFVRDFKLYEKKPDSRLFGFNHPNPSPDKPYGYEDWVTIPEDMEVPAPLVKKKVKEICMWRLRLTFLIFTSGNLLPIG